MLFYCGAGVHCCAWDWCSLMLCLLVVDGDFCCCLWGLVVLFELLGLVAGFWVSLVLNTCFSCCLCFCCFYVLICTWWVTVFVLRFVSWVAVYLV